MAELTEKERDILDHSLGGPKRYRNYFAADPCYEGDHLVIHGLVQRGLMVAGREIPGGLRYYHVTPAGKEALDATVERLPMWRCWVPSIAPESSAAMVVNAATRSKARYIAYLDIREPYPDLKLTEIRVRRGHG